MAACAIKAVFSNGIWTQQKKYENRYSLTDRCQACGDDCGSLWHRCYSCTSLDEFRASHFHCSGLNVKRWAAAGAPMWTRLLLADPSWGAPRPRLDDAIVWVLRPSDGCCSQNGFGDGSLFHGRHGRLARGGWGLVVFDENDDLQASLHGPLPGYQQDILLAELYALCMYVRHVGPEGGSASTDSQSLVSMWKKGAASCCQTFSIYAAIWTRIWRKIDDIGESSIAISWVKGHANARHVAAGIVTEFQRTANAAADDQAKRGAAMHADVNDTAIIMTARTKALQWAASYVGYAHAALWRANIRDTTPWQDRKKPRQRASAGACALPRPRRQI